MIDIRNSKGEIDFSRVTQAEVNSLTPERRAALLELSKCHDENTTNETALKAAIDAVDEAKALVTAERLAHQQKFPKMTHTDLARQFIEQERIDAAARRG